MDGGMTLNPLKKFQEQALFGKQITKGAVGLSAAGLAGAAALGTNAFVRGSSAFEKFKKKEIKDGFKTLGYGILSSGAGFFSASSRGLVGTVKGQKFGQVYKGAYGGAIQARNKRTEMKDSDVKPGDVIQSNLTHAIGGHTIGDYVKSANDDLSSLQGVYKSMMSAAEGNDDDLNSITATSGNLAGQTFNGIKGLTKFAEELQKTSINKSDFEDEWGYANGQYQVIRSADTQYFEAVKKQQDTLDEIEELKKARLNAIATNPTAAAGASKVGMKKAITEGYERMQKIAKDINDATRKIDPKITEINTTAIPSTINGMSKGVSNELAANQKAAKAQKIDSYSSKKDK